MMTSFCPAVSQRSWTIGGFSPAGAARAPPRLYAQDIWLENGSQTQVTRKRSSVSISEIFEYNYVGNQVFAPMGHFIEAGLFDERLPAWQDLEFFIRLLQKFGRAHLLDLPTYLFDATRRPDRISTQEQKIRSAFRLVAAKHAADDSSRQKTLFLQMFQHGYSIAPSATDWIWFLRSGGLPKGLLRMVRSSVANRRARRASPSAQKSTAWQQKREMSVGND